MPLPSATFPVRDYATYLATSLVYLEQAQALVEQTLARGPAGIVRDASNYWFNEWASLGEEIVRLRALSDRARRVNETPPPATRPAGVPVSPATPREV